MTIYLGTPPSGKRSIIDRYVANNGIRSVKILSPERFRIEPPSNGESIDWPEIIMYRTFYRLLREIGPETLVVVNECLRTQERSDLTYNCIRHFLSQTGHQLVFQWLPVISEPKDFMVLLDFDTKSRFKGHGVSDAEISRGQVVITDRTPVFCRIGVQASEKARRKYETTRTRLFDGIAGKDPHTIPRNLHLVSGQDKLASAQGLSLIGRNNRFSIDDMETYRTVSPGAERVVFEFPHNFIEMADFLSVTGQESVEALVADLKADQWYFNRYTEWTGRIRDAYAAIRDRERS